MNSTDTAMEADWLGACRGAVAGLRDVLAAHPRTRQRAVETGDRGEGGDRTLVIDEGAEHAGAATVTCTPSMGRDHGEPPAAGPLDIRPPGPPAG